MNLISLGRKLKSLFTPSIKPLIRVHIHSEAIRHNLREYQRAYPKLKFAPVLKSNAYGHGLTHIAHILKKEKLPLLVVDSYYEVLSLRQHGITTPILIIGYVRTDVIHSNKLKNIHFTITSSDQLKALAQSLPGPVYLHLKLDTGMHRQGILLAELKQAANLLKQNKNFQLKGICSHLADADNLFSQSTQLQLEQWQAAILALQADFPEVSYYHIAATAGLIHTTQTSQNLARLGIGLYGINPIVDSQLKLKPALSLTSIISGIKTIKKGETVGYNNTFEAPQDMTIATIPAGYAEGVDRRLSNCGQVEVRGIICQIIGRVSMNITIIDVSVVPNIQLNDEVTLISNKKNSPLSVENVAKLCQTIPYEILVHIPSYLHREIT